jgi:hypothetical protein
MREILRERVFGVSSGHFSAVWAAAGTHKVKAKARKSMVFILSPLALGKYIILLRALR